MVCTTAVYISRVKMTGKTDIAMLEIALQMMPQVEQVFRHGSTITARGKSGNYAEASIDSYGIVLRGSAASEVESNVRQYYRAVAEKAALERMGYNTQMELTENNLLRIVAVK